MGGQQFGSDGTLLDMRGMDRVLGLDRERGLVEVEAGIMWPELIAHLLEAQNGGEPAWGIAQKQTGADRLTLGGALSANVHGRGLALAPIVADVEALHPRRRRRRACVQCDRERDPELFRLAIGGYGLFGVIAVRDAAAAPRRKLERVVELRDRRPSWWPPSTTASPTASSTATSSSPSTRPRPTSCARGLLVLPPGRTGRRSPRSSGAPRGDWRRLLHLAHTDKRARSRSTPRHYLATSGQIYWSTRTSSPTTWTVPRRSTRALGRRTRAAR